MSLKLADDLKLPLDAVTQAIAILAKRRAGKSYTARRLAEQLFKAHQQIVIVDPKGDWWGIRSSADGKSPGLPVVILGGERGDVPLEPSSGEIVAKLIVMERVSVLLDLSLLRKHEVATFMTALLENLYRLKAREIYRTPLMLIIDEADAVAPQKPQKGEERMLGAAEDIVRRGGQRGIGCTLISQRSAVLNKNVLTQVQMMVALRTIAPQDLDAMKAWIHVHGTEEQKEILMDSLPSLPVGDAWFWSPGWPTGDGIFKRVDVLPIETFDSGATPKPGEVRKEPKQLADVDLEALKKQMATTIEKAKADDPRELRKKIAALEADLVRARKVEPVAAPPPVTPKVVEKPVISEFALKRIETLVHVIDSLTERTEEKLRQLHLVRGQITAAAEKFRQPVPAITSSQRPPPPRPERRIPVSTAPRRESGASDEKLSGVERRILNALAELEQLGAAKPERELVALLAGYTNLASKGFVNGMSALRTGGLIDYPSGGTSSLTDAGRAVADYSEAPRSAKEVQERICNLLGGASARILEPLIEAYPSALPRQDVAARAGYGNLASKGFVNAISRLRTLGFVDYPDRGTIVAKPVLFLEGT